MSLKKPAAFSLIVALLAVNLRLPDTLGQMAPILTVDNARPSASLSSRGERLAENAFVSGPPKSTNPVYTDPHHRFSKDPTVLEHGGKYFVYYFGFTPAGRQAIKVASSQDLVNWAYEGVALEARGDGEWDSDLIWAADVVYRDGLFYLYYSGGRKGGDGGIDWRSMRIGLAVSREPSGTFLRYAQNPVLTPPFGNGAIDAEFFADDDGKDYVFYVVQSSDQGYWEGIRMRSAFGMVHLSGDEKVIDPTADWESNIVEAPTVFKANGYYYLLYSGGRSENGQMVAYAVSRVPDVAGKGGSGRWTKYPDDVSPKPLIGRNERWSDVAVGSTAILLGPSRQLYIMYQGKSSADGKFRLGLARLLFDGKSSPVRLTR